MTRRRDGGLAASLLVVLLVVADTDIVLIRSSNARELRPSDHGLAYQGSPPMGQESSPEMLTFFGTLSSSSSSSSSASAPHLPSVALPQAMNSSDAAVQQQEKPLSSVSSSSSSSPPSSSRSRSSDRVMKEGLLIGSLVCGIAGVALLAASAFIFLFHSAKKPNSSPSCTSSASTAHPHPQLRDHNNAVRCTEPATAD